MSTSFSRAQLSVFFADESGTGDSGESALELSRRKRNRKSPLILSRPGVGPEFRSYATMYTVYPEFDHANRLLKFMHIGSLLKLKSAAVFARVCFFPFVCLFVFCCCFFGGIGNHMCNGESVKTRLCHA